MKWSRHFEVSVPFTEMVFKGSVLTPVLHCNLTFSGVAYCWDDDGDMDFDIDQVFFEGKDIKPALTALVGDIKGEEKVKGPINSYLTYLFADILKQVA